MKEYEQRYEKIEFQFVPFTVYILLMPLLLLFNH